MEQGTALIAGIAGRHAAVPGPAHITSCHTGSERDREQQVQQKNGAASRGEAAGSGGNKKRMSEQAFSKQPSAKTGHGLHSRMRGLRRQTAQSAQAVQHCALPALPLSRQRSMHNRITACTAQRCASSPPDGPRKAPSFLLAPSLIGRLISKARSIVQSQFKPIALHLEARR